MRVCFKCEHNRWRSVPFSCKDNLVKLVEQIASLGRGLRGILGEKVFVCGGFASQFFVLIITWVPFVDV